MSSLAVVLVTYNSAGGLPAVLDALAAQRRAGDQVVVVDNGSRDDSAAIARTHPTVDRVLEPGENLGFAAGCNCGASATIAPILLFLNPDAVPQPGCLDALREAPADWAAWQGVVLLGDGVHVNSAGNDVHFLGLSWAGRFGEAVERLPTEPWEAPALSGACLAVRRRAWSGFPEHFFMYFEDLDLSLRLHLAGARIGVVPAAHVVHDYEFDKGAGKRRQLERNRWMCVLRCWPSRLLLPTLPLLLALEPLLLLIALREGWAGAKARAIGDVIAGLPRLLRERREIQASRVLDASGFAALLRSDLRSPFLGRLGTSPAVARLLAAAWRVVRSLADVPQ